MTTQKPEEMSVKLVLELQAIGGLFTQGNLDLHQTKQKFEVLGDDGAILYEAIESLQISINKMNLVFKQMADKNGVRAPTVSVF